MHFTERLPLFGYVNGTGDDVDRLEGIKTLLQDRLTEDMLSMAAMVTNHWKDYLEIRTHPSNTYALFLFAETFRQQKGIDIPLDLSTIKALHEQVIAETEGPHSDEKEVEIQAKVIARWLGIDEKK